MTTLRHAGTTAKIDDAGYLVDQNEWNEEVAQFLASREGVEKLTAEQVEIIRFMRDYYHKFHAFPILSQVCKNIKQPRNCVNEQFIDPGKAWKIAGLPKLDGVHFVSLDGGKSFLLEECC